MTNPTPEIAEDLAACPFCGGPGDIEQGPASQASGSHCSYRGWCDRCCYGLEWTTDQREAIAAWNARPTPPKVAGAAEEIAGLGAVEKARRIYRALEMSAGIMRDGRRTGGWEGSERTASAFERQAEAAKELHAMLIAQARVTASLAVEIEALQSALDANWVTHQRVTAAEAARLAAERKLEAAVGHLEAMLSQFDAEEYCHEGEMQTCSAATTFLAAMNTGADDAE